MDECIHGMNPDWCGICKEPATGRSARASTPVGIGRTKQDELNLLCDQLGVPRAPIGVGSSLPSDVFEAVRLRFSLRARSMPEIAEAAAREAGLPWRPEYDSRGTVSGGGSTVTLEGLAQLNRAVSTLLGRL